MSSQKNRRYSPPRTAPRRRKPRRTVLRNIVLPSIKTAFLVGVGLLIVGTAAQRTVRAGRLCDQEGRQARAESEELQGLREENTQLESKLKKLGTPEGIGDGARKLGMVKPGEIVLVLPPE